MNELKNLQSYSLTTMGIAVKQAFDVLNINRMTTGIDTYGQGRCPFYLETAVIVLITDGGRLTTSMYYWINIKIIYFWLVVYQFHFTYFMYGTCFQLFDHRKFNILDVRFKCLIFFDILKKFAGSKFDFFRVMCHNILLIHYYVYTIHTFC